MYLKILESKLCCGCGACIAKCPTSAISFVMDDYGFKFPQINKSACIDCGSCFKCCNYQIQPKLEKQEVFSAQTKIDWLLDTSASGGVVSTMAKKFISSDGVVYGCEMKRVGEIFEFPIVRIAEVKDIVRIQGSKYVQSDSCESYRLVERDLRAGINVLYTGTPCQIAALKGYLGNVEQSKLYTIDIICHGVPNSKMLNEYLHTFEKNNYKVEKFSFRDKKYSWGLKGKVQLQTLNRKKIKRIQPQLSSYYNMFLEGEIYRDSCYSCKFANLNRPGDITVGDFWGFEKEHAELLKKNGGKIDEKNGVSCVLINSTKGKKLFDVVEENFHIFSSTIDKVAKLNTQLTFSSNMPDSRRKIMELYKDGGYAEINKYYFQRLGIKKYLFYLWNCVPIGMQHKLKSISIFNREA